jgi:hypothetical protein
MAYMNNILMPRAYNIVLASSAFAKEELDQIDYMKQIVSGSLKTRHLGYNFTSDDKLYMDDMAKHFDVFVCTKAFSITFTEFNKDSNLEIGDYIAFPSELNYSTEASDDSYIFFEIYYWPIVKSKDTDTKSYKVLATLTDKYEIEISANSEKEAYDKAYNTPLSDWKHLTPGGISKARKILRWAEWGDFETKEIPS